MKTLIPICFFITSCSFLTDLEKDPIVEEIVEDVIQKEFNETPGSGVHLHY